MTLSVGDRVPTANLFEPGESGPAKLTTDSLFKGRKVVRTSPRTRGRPGTRLAHTRQRKLAEEKLSPP